MYKILLKRSERGVKSLYEFVTTVENDDNGFIEKIEMFENEKTLNTKIKDLLLTRSINDIVVIQDKTYDVDILFTVDNSDDSSDSALNEEMD